MAVYVDDSSIQATIPNGRTQHTSRWSHLFADTREELREFAEQLGLRRSYFQPGRPRGDGSPSPHWHYDVTAGKRQQAIRLGAQPVTWRESTEIMRERDAKAGRAKLAEQAARAAFAAHQEGSPAIAARYLAVARATDPSQGARWTEAAVRIAEAARAKGTEAAGPDDPRPLPAIVAARLEAAGVTADSPELRFIGAWNADRMAAAEEAEPSPADEAQPATEAEPLPDLLTDAEREAG